MKQFSVNCTNNYFFIQILSSYNLLFLFLFYNESHIYSEMEFFSYRQQFKKKVSADSSLLVHSNIITQIKSRFSPTMLREMRKLSGIQSPNFFLFYIERSYIWIHFVPSLVQWFLQTWQLNEHIVEVVSELFIFCWSKDF